MSRLGPYTLLRRLAVGGMAEIFLARRDGPAGFSKVVALKRILPHLSTLSEFVSMFLDEARLAARLTHPNVVQIYDFGEVDGTYFISMEYVPGEDLLAAIKRARELERPAPPIVACSILSAVCDGLHYAHELRDEYGKTLGIVHRDVTPSNVLISFDGVVKLADFGIAKAEHRSTHTAVGALKGKYAYMSPEQARGVPLDRRSDVFSLGVVAHELLTGRRLFSRENELAVLKAITEEPIPRPSTVRPDLPLELEGIIMKALARDPERRFATAQAMQLALEEHIAATGSTGARLHLAHYLRDLFGNEAAIARKRLAAGEVEDVEPTTAPPSDAAVAAVVASARGMSSAGVPRPAQAATTARLELPLAAEPTATLSQHDYARMTGSSGGVVNLGSGGTMAHTHGESAPRSLPAELSEIPILRRPISRLWWLMGAGLALGVVAGAIWFTRGRDAKRTTREIAANVPPSSSSIPTRAPLPTPAPTPPPVATPVSAPTPTPTPEPGPPKSDPPKPTVASVAPKPKPIDRRKDKDRPRPAAASYLTLDVTPRADVLLDGDNIGSPPIARRKIDPGKHTLTLVGRDEGFRVTSTFTVAAGAEHTEKRTLKKGKLACDADPWAEVFAGSQKLGTTPLAPIALTEGTYTLRLRNPENKKEKKVRVTIKAGQVTTVKEKLE